MATYTESMLKTDASIKVTVTVTIAESALNAIGDLPAHAEKGGPWLESAMDDCLTGAGFIVLGMAYMGGDDLEIVLDAPDGMTAEDAQAFARDTLRKLIETL